MKRVSKFQSPRRGMTLAELLVVISILAITTAVAVQAMGPVANQARHDATLRTLGNVSSAIASVNASSVSGFIIDTGRLPSTSTSVASLPPSVDELTGVYPSSATTGPPADLGFYQTISLPLFVYTSATKPTTTTSVTISSGWNGPYLLAPSGSYSASSTTSIVDGWGQALPAFLYPDTSNGNGLTIWSKGDPTSAQTISTTVVPSQLAASVLTVNAVNSSNIPASPSWGAGPYYYAMYGPAPHGVFASPPATGTMSAGTFQAAFGTAVGNNPAPAVSLYTVAFATSASLPTWLSTLPVLGPRVFCILDSQGYVVAGPLYRVVLPGTNTVQFLVQ